MNLQHTAPRGAGRRQALAALALAIALPAALVHAGDTAWLVTPAEVARSAGHKIPLRALPGGDHDTPRLTLLQPETLGTPLASPFPIRLAFEPSRGAEIVPGSFKALYGYFRVDITSRILEHAEVRADGLSLAEARIPPGEHELLLRIEDSRHRVGEMSIEFTVR